MSYIRQFAEFDPLTGDVPSYPFSSLASIAQRARKVLQDCKFAITSDEIVSAAKTIDWMIDEYFLQAKEDYIRSLAKEGGWELKYLPEDERNEAGIRRLLDNWPSEAEDPPPLIPNAENTSEAAALKECIHLYALEEEPGYPNGRPSKYFAILALWKVGDSIRWLNKDVMKTPRDLSLVVAIDHAFVAMEAICNAEHLEDLSVWENAADFLRQQIDALHARSEENAEARAKAKISLANSKAAIKRHAETREMREQVVKHYEAHGAEYPSIEAAAAAIAKKLVPVTHRTVVDWIRAFKKEQSARRP